MNRAKKIMNDKQKQKPRRTSGGGSGLEMKFKVLLVLGLVLALGFSSVVCYIEFRPRPVLVITSKDANGAEVKDTVTYKEAMYDIYTVETQYNSMNSLYQQYYGSSYWEATNVDSKGRTGAQAAKKEVMDTLKQREILCLEAEKKGVALTAAEKKTADETVTSTLKNMSDAQKKMAGLSEKEIRRAAYRQALANKYKNQIIDSIGINEDAIKAGVSKKDYRQYTLQYYTVAKTKTEDNKTVDLDAKTLAANKKAIQEVCQKAKTAKDFTKNIITDSNNDNADDKTGVSYSTENLIETDTNFADEAARKKIKAMKNNEISDVIETKDAYYVIKMVNNNDSAAYDSQCEKAVSDEKESQFETKYKSDIKPNYTTEVQSFWKGRVTLGGITTAAN